MRNGLESPTSDQNTPAAGQPQPSVSKLRIAMPPALTSPRVGEVSPNPRADVDDEAADDVSQAAAATSLLSSPACSSYFLESMSWMADQLASGVGLGSARPVGLMLTPRARQDGPSKLAGRLLCPRKSCSARLGRFDWSGLACSCERWVVPGFALLASRVDEV